MPQKNIWEEDEKMRKADMKNFIRLFKYFQITIYSIVLIPHNFIRHFVILAFVRGVAATPYFILHYALYLKL